jgi:hypothetical protein
MANGMRRSRCDITSHQLRRQQPRRPPPASAAADSDGVRAWSLRDRRRQRMMRAATAIDRAVGIRAPRLHRVAMRPSPINRSCRRVGSNRSWLDVVFFGAESPLPGFWLTCRRQGFDFTRGRAAGANRQSGQGAAAPAVTASCPEPRRHDPRHAIPAAPRFFPLENGPRIPLPTDVLHLLVVCRRFGPDERASGAGPNSTLDRFVMQSAKHRRQKTRLPAWREPCRDD